MMGSLRFFLMDQTQVSGQLVVVGGLGLLAKLLVSVPQVNVERRVKALYALVVGRLGMGQSNQVPVQGVLRILVAGDVVGGDAGFVVVVGRFPGLPKEIAGIVYFPFKLGAITGQAKLDGGIVCIHTLLL